MENSDFLLSCIISFAVVFLVLSILYFSIQLIIFLFPEKSSDDDDPALLAALNSHLSRVYPHTQITKVEEQK